MSFRTFPGGLPRRFRVVQQSFLQRDDLAFADVLSEQDIQAAFDAEGVTFAQEPDDVYTPSVTLWAFLSQAVFKAEHRSCVAAVARVAVLMAALRGASRRTRAAYCRARAKLPEVVLERLAMQLADGCEETAPAAWLWQRKHVHLVDGTTLSAPDTPANQAAWPQPTNQEEGLGFPLIRLVVVLSLATALLTGMALGPYAGKETGETALFRSLLRQLPRGDIFVADRYLCSYFMIALAREQGVDAVVRQHQLRITDFRRGQSLGKEDHLARWHRPQRPAWMDLETYEQMPEFLDVRELRVHVHQPGFRTEALVVVTTLTDHRTYSSQDIAALYHKRWLVETNHAHYVQRFSFPQGDESTYTGNQGTIGAGAMVPALPAVPARLYGREAMSDVTDDRVPPAPAIANRSVLLKDLWTSVPESNRQKITQVLGQLLQRQLESPPARKEMSNERV